MDWVQKICAIVNGCILTTKTRSPGLLKLLVLPIFTMCGYANAVSDNWNVDGENGVFRIYGKLENGTCHLDMASILQEIQFPNVNTNSLKSPGDRSQSVALHITLKDCFTSWSNQDYLNSGMLTRDTINPIIAIAFVGVADEDNPELLKLIGVEGAGIRITNCENEDVILGKLGKPQFTAGGQGRLDYNVAVERTSKQLSAGSFRSVVNFRINYE